MDNSHSNNSNTAPPGEHRQSPSPQPGFPPNVFFVNYHFTFSPPNAGFQPAGDETGQQDEQQQQQQQPDTPRQAAPFQGFFFYTMPGGMPAAGNGTNNQNMPFEFFEEPPKPHASKSAVAALEDVDLSSISEADRTCSICFEPYYDAKSHVETLNKDAVHDHSSDVATQAESEKPTVADAAHNIFDTEDEKKATDDSEHVPLQMPCGHIFGRNCLKEWLASSTTCPLCRTAIEAETQEPRQFRTSTFLQNGFPLFIGPLFNIIAGARARSTATPDAQGHESATTPAEPAAAVPASAPDTPVATPSQAQGPAISRSLSFTLSARNRNHPYHRRSAPGSSTSLTNVSSSSSSSVSSSSATLSSLPPTLESVLSRPDLECGSASLGLCEESGPYIRLTCGHGFHEDCLRSATRSHGDADIPILRSEEDISSAGIDGPRVYREVWCMRCRRYVDVDV
ncbi:uncharacterized protein V2V93DRAFT_370890 [Kockiozyma suomiensis]|uniref:uncharacterized protein n=1 Tax=Kockiozyma suomiensis TaxID=1337062 RepID=UPI003342E899